MLHEKRIRSIAKALSWRMMATLITMTLVWAFTGNFSLVFGVGVLDVVIKLLFYYFHERVWGRVEWGKGKK